MSNTREKKRLDSLSRMIVFFILLLFWVIFSGKFDAFHLSLGVVCCALVSYLSHDLFFHDLSGKNNLRKTGRFILYIPWLIYQIVLANLHVAYLVLNPKAIRPEIIKFKTRLKSDFSMVTLANSITLTPGTITMDIINGEFYVHALSQKVADDLMTGEMEQRVAHIYFEEEGK